MDLSTYGGYNDAVATSLGLGDVIRKARKDRGLNQETLGENAASLDPRRGVPIDKNTVSKVERDPYSSEFGTVCRLLAALGLTLADVEREVGPAFTPIADVPASTPIRVDTTPSVPPAVAAADLPAALRRTAAKGMSRVARLKETRALRPKGTVAIPGKAAQKRRPKKRA